MIVNANQLFSQTGSLQFDGIDDYIEIDNTTFNTINDGNFSIEAWVTTYESLQNPNPVVFSNRSGSNQGIKLFFRDQIGNPIFKQLVINVDGIDYYLDNNNTTINFSHYYCFHIAVTRNSNTLTFFLNGNSQGSIETPGEIPSISSTNALLIGKDQTDSTKFKGLISGLRIWNKALSIEEIKENQLEIISGSTPNLIGYWNFRDMANQNVQDLTNNSKGQLGNTLFQDENDPTWIEYGSAPRIDLGEDTITSIDFYESCIKNPDNALLTWSDGFKSTESYPCKAYFGTGSYWVEALNNCGVSRDYIEIQFKVRIYLPNTFAPDRNAFNETIRPYLSHNPDYFNFTIFNRNRQVIFESQDPEGEWDGSFNGTIVPSGVYAYILLFTNPNTRKVEEYKGTITVLR